MSGNDIVKSSGNVFIDLGFTPAEAAVMLIRVEIAHRISERIKANGWTLSKAAEHLNIPKSYVSLLLINKTEDLNLDTLWMVAVRAGLKLELSLIAQNDLR